MSSSKVNSNTYNIRRRKGQGQWGISVSFSRIRNVRACIINPEKKLKTQVDRPARVAGEVVTGL